MNSYEELNSRGNFDYNTYNPSYNYDQSYSGYNNIPSQNNFQYNQPNYSFDQSSPDNNSIRTPPEPYNYFNQLDYTNQDNETKTPLIEPPFDQITEPFFEPKAESFFDPKAEPPFEAKAEPPYEAKIEFPFERNASYDPLSGNPPKDNKEDQDEERVVSMYFDNDPSDEFRPPPLVKNKSLNENSVVEKENKIKIINEIPKGEILLDDDPSDEFKLPKNAFDIKSTIIKKEETANQINDKISNLNQDTMSDLDENEIENDAYTPGLEWNRFKPIRPKSTNSELEDNDLSKREVNSKTAEQKPGKISSPKLIGKPVDGKLSPKDLEAKPSSLENNSLLKNRTENSSPTLFSKSLENNEKDLVHRQIKSPKLVSKKVSAEIMAKLKSKEELDSISPKNIPKTKKLTSPKFIEKVVFQPQIVTPNQLSPKLAKLKTKSPVLLKPNLEAEFKVENKNLEVKPNQKESSIEPIEKMTSESILKAPTLIIESSSPKSTLENEPKNSFKPILVSSTSPNEKHKVESIIQLFENKSHLMHDFQKKIEQESNEDKKIRAQKVDTADLIGNLNIDTVKTAVDENDKKESDLEKLIDDFVGSLNEKKKP